MHSNNKDPLTTAITQGANSPVVPAPYTIDGGLQVQNEVMLVGDKTNGYKITGYQYTNKDGQKIIQDGYLASDQLDPHTHKIKVLDREIDVFLKDENGVLMPKQPDGNGRKLNQDVQGNDVQGKLYKLDDSESYKTLAKYDSKVEDHLALFSDDSATPFKVEYVKSKFSKDNEPDYLSNSLLIRYTKENQEVSFTIVIPPADADGIIYQNLSKQRDALKETLEKRAEEINGQIEIKDLEEQQKTLSCAAQSSFIESIFGDKKITKEMKKRLQEVGAKIQIRSRKPDETENKSANSTANQGNEGARGR